MRVVSLCVLCVPLCVLLGTLGTVSGERHSLTYIYTALSKKVSNPGIHEFMAMGQMDTKVIDYFDSDLQQKVPKRHWMKERLSQDYWNKGTESRKSKQQWFKVNLDILKDRMNQTNDDLHVLQWMHGCEADRLPDGTLSFQRGIDMYSYDGNNFLYFDDAHDVWVAAAEAAKPTKRKWDEVQVLKDYTKGYLEKECLDWLQKFMDYGKQELIRAIPPKVYMFASPARHKSNVMLTCMATGFYPPDIVLNIKRDGRILREDDGVMTTGIRPNQDDTYQRRDTIQILRTDTGTYTCEVSHAASNMHIDIKWDGKILNHDEGGDLTVGVVAGVFTVVLLIALIVAGVLLYKKKRRKQYSEVLTVSSRMRVNDACPLACVSSDGSSSSSSGRSTDDIDKKDGPKISVDSAIGPDAVEKPLLENGTTAATDGRSSPSSSSGVSSGGSTDKIDKEESPPTSEKSSVDSVPDAVKPR